MRLFSIAGAAILAAGVATAALAQPYPGDYPPAPEQAYAPPPNHGPGDNPNTQAYGAFQDQQNAYEAGRDTAAEAQDAYDQQRGDYAQQRAAYEAEREAYQHRLRRYERARADYDALYGPGAYERYYPIPATPY